MFSYYYLEPYTYVKYVDDTLLFVNAYSGKVITFDVLRHASIKKQISELVEKRIICTNNIGLKKANNGIFWNKVFKVTRKYFMADFSNTQNIFLQDFDPKINYNIIKEPKNTFNNTNALSELLVFVDMQKKEEDKRIDYRQILYPSFGKHNKTINKKHLIDFLKDTPEHNLGRVTLIVHNISNELIKNVMQTLPSKTEIVIRTSNKIEMLIDFLDTHKFSQNKITVEMLFFQDQKIDDGTMTFLQNKKYNITPIRIVKHEDVAHEFSEHFEHYPLYNAQNISFFKKNVFTRYRDIVDSNPTMIDLFQKQHINPLFFGKLFILPDGKVYSNLYKRSIGDIANSAAFDLIQKELIINNSWRFLRRNVTPCKKCVFQDLCPPISSYEFAMGKFNLCTIKS